MTDGLSSLYQDLLGGSYDCVDRIVLNAYFRMGHDPGGFRVWWRALTGSDETLENTYLMRLGGPVKRRHRGYAKAHGIPVIDCPVGQRKHDLAEEYLAKTTVTQGLFLVLVGRAQAPVWDVGAKHHIERKKPMPYVNHYSFHILDPDWGHLTIKSSGHPPFPAQVILNGHEYVACQARKAGITFTKQGNCFTTISDAAGLAKIADTCPSPGLRAAPNWAQSVDCAALTQKQSYQTPPGRRSTSPPSTRGAQPKTDRHPLPGHPSCNERRLP